MMINGPDDAGEPAEPRFAGLAGRLEGDPDPSNRRPPLILLHGLTFDRTMWQPAVTELRKLDPGRQVFAIDLPGHGQSPAWPSNDTVWPASGHFPHLAHPRRFAECLAATTRWTTASRQLTDEAAQTR